MPNYSFEQIRELVHKALAAKFPAPEQTAQLDEFVECVMQTVSRNNGELTIIDEDGHVDAPITEAGKRNSATDSLHANAIVRHALSMMDGGDLEPATHAHMAHHMNPPIGAEAVADQGELTTESWNGLDGETFTETFSLPLAEASFDKENLIIRNTAVLGANSLNGRDYPTETQEKAVSVLEGAKAYLNHPYPEDMAKPRKVEHLIGEHRNVHVETINGVTKTYSDLHLLDKPLVRNEVIPIVESKPHLAGNSVVIRARQRKGENGRMIIEEILAARSIDLVAEPGTTKGIYESHIFRKETEMEFKDITLESLKQNRNDLVEAILAASKEQEKIGALTTENAQLQERMKNELATRDGKIAELELKEAKRQEEEMKQTRRAQVVKLFTEAKIPDRVKYEEKDGKKVVKGHYLNLLERCANEDEMKALVGDWEKTFIDTKPISEGKVIHFDNNDKPVTADAVTGLYDAFVH